MVTVKRNQWSAVQFPLEKSEPLLRAVVCLRQYLAKQRHLPEKSWLHVAEITDEMQAKEAKTIGIALGPPMCFYLDPPNSDGGGERKYSRK